MQLGDLGKRCKLPTGSGAEPQRKSSSIRRRLDLDATNTTRAAGVLVVRESESEAAATE